MLVFSPASPPWVCFQELHSSKKKVSCASSVIRTELIFLHGLCQQYEPHKARPESAGENPPELSLSSYPLRAWYPLPLNGLPPLIETECSLYSGFKGHRVDQCLCDRLRASTSTNSSHMCGVSVLWPWLCCQALPWGAGDGPRPTHSSWRTAQQVFCRINSVLLSYHKKTIYTAPT